MKKLIFISLSLFIFSCVKQTKDINEWSIQSRLDQGESIRDIMLSHQQEDFYGKEYQGGTIFYLNENDGLGLVLATEDQSNGVIFGCNNFTNSLNTEIGNGDQNTAWIMQNCSTQTNAASLCYNLDLNGYDDWYLPNRDEGEAIFDNLPRTWMSSTNGYYYWLSNFSYSSAECITYNYHGVQNNKDSLSNVRAVRKFTF